MTEWTEDRIELSEGDLTEWTEDRIELSEGDLTDEGREVGCGR